MPKKPFEALSEPMFYILMALSHGAMCGADITAWIRQRTDERVVLGPGTLYTILPKLTEAELICQVELSGRKRSYTLTDKGYFLYNSECDRLRRCVADIEKAEPLYRKEA